jgi:hypothetical protein
MPKGKRVFLCTVLTDYVSLNRESVGLHGIGSLQYTIKRDLIVVCYPWVSCIYVVVHHSSEMQRVSIGVKTRMVEINNALVLLRAKVRNGHEASVGWSGYAQWFQN